MAHPNTIRRDAAWLLGSIRQYTTEMSNAGRPVPTETIIRALEELLPQLEELPLPPVLSPNELRRRRRRFGGRGSTISDTGEVVSSIAWRLELAERRRLAAAGRRQAQRAFQF